jgi:hypothetical protein
MGNTNTDCEEEIYLKTDYNPFYDRGFLKKRFIK